MFVKKYDKFAFLPKRCSFCDTAFIWEKYIVGSEVKGLVGYDVERVKCKRCMKG